VLLGSARNAVRAGNLPLALKRFEEYLKAKPDDHAVRKEYAGVLVQAGELERAARQFLQLIPARPKDPTLRTALADVYLASKEYSRAIEQLRQAVDLAPTNLEAAVKLARAYTFENDFTNATRIYDRYLAGIQPDDEKAPRGMGSLLLDLERPDAALTFLKPLLARRPDDLEVLAELVRAYTRLGDRGKTAEALSDLARASPRERSVRLALADTLYESGDYEPAAVVYGQVLQADPENDRARVGLARIHLQQFSPQQARSILEGMKPEGAAQRIWKLTWAEYHQAVGEYAEATEIYKEFLRADEKDYAVHLALGALYEFIREDEKAKAEYSKVQPATPALRRKARLGIASTLSAQRLFAAANDLASHLLAEEPGDPGPRALLARNLSRTGQCGKAEALCRSFLQSQPLRESVVVAVRLALGEVLLRAGKNNEAVREYESLLAAPRGRTPAAWYGLAQAHAKMGNKEKAEQALASVLSPLGGDTRPRLRLADLFAADQDDHTAVEMCQSVLKHEPQNLAALIRLVDAQTRLAVFSGQPKEAIATARSILHLSPTNVRGQLALARALATAKQYHASANEYARLLAIDRELTVPARERARVLYAANAYGPSAGAYAELQVPPAQEQLQGELTALAQRDPQSAALLQPVVRAHLTGAQLQAELPKLASASGVGPFDAAGPPPGARSDRQQPVSDAQRALTDFQARSAEQAGAHLEGSGKALKGWRNYKAIGIYKDLVAAEPSNIEAAFDLGQLFSATKQTRLAIDAYQFALGIDPLHRDSAVALDRAGMELQPQLVETFTFFHQHGFNNTANINRLRFDTEVVIPWRDEDEFIQVGYSPVLYEPPGAPTLDGNIATFRAQAKPIAPLLWYGQVNFEEFRDRFHDRVTFDTGLRYTLCDVVLLRLSGFLENVAENSESLVQDIYRGGIRAGGEVHPSRVWDFGGDYQVAMYSDKNTLNGANLYNEVLLCFLPDQVKLVQKLNLLTAAHPTVFVNGPNDIVGAIHPYFAPDQYAYAEARVEYTHYFSRDTFAHSNVCWVSLQYGVGCDNSFHTYNQFRAVGNWDVKSCLSVGVDFQQTISPVYSATGLVAYLILRWPWF
jgi:tetratricopeptide (TPR) repeat protein